MVGRYLITGAQIGLIKKLLLSQNEDEIIKLLDEIQKKQFIGNSEDSVESDSKKLCQTDVFGKILCRDVSDDIH
jgi:hypothetical protein